jgi:hypothetical protein
MHGGGIVDELDDILLWHVETVDGGEDRRTVDLPDLFLAVDDDAAFERWLASAPARDLDARLSRLVDGNDALAPLIDLAAS